MIWVEKSEVLDDILNQEDMRTTDSMTQGFEAEVMKISLSNESFVLKVWNKSSRPNIRLQYQLLNHLHERGLPVSKPVGWGMNSNDEQVLLTTYNGTPIHKLDTEKMAELADILSSIHQIQASEMVTIPLPKNDFIDYFFHAVGDYPDIQHVLIPFMQKAQMKQGRVIHGDFHLGNLLEDSKRYTVIDWTNGQIGDARYDFAWALILLKIYVPEPFIEPFRSTYLLKNHIRQEELDIYEALACLRWVMLYRCGFTPRGSDVIQRVRSILLNNPWLQGVEF